MHPEVAGGAGAHKEVHRGVLGRRGLDLLKISKKYRGGSFWEARSSYIANAKVFASLAHFSAYPIG